MSARPPRLAEWLLAISLHPGERDVVLGDVAEGFAARRAADGHRRARRWYWRQALSSVGPNLRRHLTRPRARQPRRAGSMMDAFVHDVRYAMRRLVVRRAGMSAMALASLGLGMALATVVFSLFNAVVLRPLPVDDPDRLGLVLEVRPTGLNETLPYLDFVDYRRAQTSFTDLVAYSIRDVNVRQSGAAQMVRAEMVTGAYFEVLGVRMRAGRPLVESDDRPGAPPVAVVSESFWRTLTGREPTAFAPETLTINTQTFDIVGIAAAPFRGMQLGQNVRVWFPLHAESAIDPTAERIRASRQTSWLWMVGRLAPGFTREAAAAELNRLDAELAPAVGRPAPRTYIVTPGGQGHSNLPEAAGSPLRILLGAALLVVLVAAANVANLLIARSVERAREMAVRSALGAGRLRLARLILFEAVLLGTAAAALALVAAPVIARQLVPFMADFGEPVTLDVVADWRVALFAAGLALLTAMLTGIGPAVTVLGQSGAQGLAETSRGASAGPRTARVRQALVVLQFAVSLALVVVAALLSRTVYNLQTLPTGLDIDHVALLSVDPEAAQYDAALTSTYLNRAIQRLEAVPGVRAAAFSRVPPLGFGGSRMTVAIPGYTPGDDEDMELNYDRVTSGYADAVGLDVIAGRWFTDLDTRGSRRVIIVNETMARRYWPAGAAVGRSVRFGREGPEVEVVGVVRDVKYRMLREAPRPSFYVPFAQMPALGGVLYVRTVGDPDRLLPSLRDALIETDSAVPVTLVRTLREQAAINVTDERLAMLIASVLGGTALLLAAVGLYASVSYMVGQRVREFGVRVALGATGVEVRRLVLRQGVLLAVVGTTCGTGLAIGLARLVQNRLYGVSIADPVSLVCSALVLAAVALVASDVPARRASHLDPVRSLREE